MNRQYPVFLIVAWRSAAQVKCSVQKPYGHTYDVSRRRFIISLYDLNLRFDWGEGT